MGPAFVLQKADIGWYAGIATDPYLSGALVFETVSGVQSQGVITSTKVSFEYAGSFQTGAKWLTRYA